MKCFTQVLCAVRVSALCIFLGGLLSFRTTASSADEPPRPALQRAIAVLESVPQGRELLTDALKLWRLKSAASLPQWVKWGRASRTDATLTRHLDGRTGEERREREVTVYLRQDQSLPDLVLDLAHELAHATARPAWDPYDPTLSAGKFILASIEGPGGEVEAVTRECRVAYQLHRLHGANGKFQLGRCAAYLNPKGAVDVARLKKDFYRIGHWSPELNKVVGLERSFFPLLTPQEPIFLSSTGQAPYPVALAREYEQLTQVACDNSRKRVEALAAQTAAKPGRSLASAPQTQPTEAAAHDFLVRRCRTF